VKESRKQGGLLGPQSMVKIENEVVGPAVRGVRRAGMGLGKAFGLFVLLFGLLLLLGGIPLVLLNSPVLTVLGGLLIAGGVMAAALGGGSVLAFRRVHHKLENKDIESHLFKMMAADGQVSSLKASRTLGVELAEVERIARRLAADGKLERDVDAETATEVYYPLGWRGRTQNEALNDPARHSERRAMDDFDRKLQEVRSPARGGAGRAEEQTEDAEEGVGSR